MVRGRLRPALVLCVAGLFGIVTVFGDAPAESQLPEYAVNNPLNFIFPPKATDQKGVRVPSLTASQSVGKGGTIVMQDNNFLDHMAHFDRERIPERVVHAKAAGAFGYFRTTTLFIKQYTKADLFSAINKITPVAIRISTVGGELGSADTVRDPRGFAVKFYTDAGNWDLAGNNIENFPIRDPILFPSLIHSRKRNPRTHLKDCNMFWDFSSLRPESTFHTLILFGDRGLPDGVRKMDGFGVHTFKLVDAGGNPVFCKFHWIAQQPKANLTPQQAQQLAGSDPDYSIRDLYNAIAAGQFPRWKLMVQIMTYQQAATVNFNPFDLTKIWFVEDFPLHEVGMMTLTRNPTDYFAEVEQAIFHPGNMVPGIEPSPDPMLHGRIFSYSDTQRYRLGANYLQIPVNSPLPGVRVDTYERDGFMTIDGNGFGAPNYFPNSYGGPVVDPNAAQNIFNLTGQVVRDDTGGVNGVDNFSQATRFWNQQTAQAQTNTINNIASDLMGCENRIRNQAIVNMFDQTSAAMGQAIRQRIIVLQQQAG